MCMKFLILIYITTSLVFCDMGVKRNYRKPKFISFDTTDDEISVALEFSIPFVTISTKKVVDSTLGIFSGFPAVNINAGALALGGVVLIGSTVIIPLLLKKHFIGHPDYRMSRLLNDAEFSSQPVLDKASELLTDSKTVRGCTLRIACFTAKQTSMNFDPIMVWNNVLSNTMMSSLFNTSAIEDAMLSGRNGRDCKTYSPCPIREDYLPVLLNKFISLANSVG